MQLDAKLSAEQTCLEAQLVYSVPWALGGPSYSTEAELHT